MIIQKEVFPYKKESEVFAVDEHITGPFVQSLGLTDISTEEQIIHAINERLARVEMKSKGDIYVAKIT
jgi:hypothetical protein